MRSDPTPFDLPSALTDLTRDVDVHLTVVGDQSGTGFDTTTPEGFGLRGMRERAALVVDPTVARALAAPRPATSTLTAREVDVLRQIATGASNREIAARLHLSEGTVKNHVSRILSRLGLRDRTQLALYTREL